MIPKIIHYCWFGHNPLPPLAIKCISSWKKYLPNYEIKEWNESNFDVNSIPYTRDAYQANKYAFVSDYARFWILYHYGGIYFDTDVEVIKSMDDIIAKGPFMGFEADCSENSIGKVAPGLGLGVETHNPIYKELIELYSGLSFTVSSMKKTKTIVTYTTELFIKHGLTNKVGIQNIDGIIIYPSEFFCPIHTITRKLHITENTRTIHWYMASWSKKNHFEIIKKKMQKELPTSFLLFYNRLKSKIKQHYP